MNGIIKQNLLAEIPEIIEKEFFETIISHDQIRIERIVSRGHASPDNFWYDQDLNEWVVVLKGSAAIKFDDGCLVELQPGDSVNIPAHKRHRVERTDRNSETVWLAVFY